MSIPEPTDDLALQRAQHRQLAALLAQLNSQAWRWMCCRWHYER